MGLTVLPAAARLVEPDLFRSATRRGQRSASRTLVTHLLVPLDREVVGVFEPSSYGGPRVGFVVSKKVGNAVCRNRVKRRLRHLMRERLDVLPRGATLVVRTNPAAADASSDELGRDLDHCLNRALERASR